MECWLGCRLGKLRRRLYIEGSLVESSEGNGSGPEFGVSREWTSWRTVQRDRTGVRESKRCLR